MLKRAFVFLSPLPKSAIDCNFVGMSDILAIKNGITKRFTVRGWAAMPPHRYGWVPVPGEIENYYDNNTAQKDGQNGNSDAEAVRDFENDNRNVRGVQGIDNGAANTEEKNAPTTAGRRGRKPKQ